MGTTCRILFPEESKKMRLLGFILLLPCLVLAQPQFFGYYESEADVLQLGAQRYSFGYHKFRLDLESRPSDKVLIGTNVNVQRYWGQTTWNVFDFLPGYSNSGLVENFDLPDTILVDNLYLRLTFDWFDLTLGRQQISTGVGYAWNPIDIFNSKSLLDPSYEQTGIEALRMDIPLGNRSSLIGIIQPKSAIKQSTQQYIFKSGLGSFDFALTGSRQHRITTTSPILGDVLIKERDMFGGSMVGEFLGMGVWGEFSRSILIRENPYAGFSYSASIAPAALPDKTYNEYVLGLDHTFDNSLYILAEYLHNGLGDSKTEELSLSDYIASLEGQTHSLMQDYAFFYLTHPTFDLVSLSALVIANFNDNSGTFAPQLDWNVFQNTNISFQGSLYWGADDTEFGLQDWGLRLRVRSSF